MGLEVKLMGLEAVAFEWDDGTKAVAGDGIFAMLVDGVWTSVPSVKIGELDEGWKPVFDSAKAAALLKEARQSLSV